MTPRGPVLNSPRRPTAPTAPGVNVRRLALEIITAWQQQNAPGTTGGPFLDDLLAASLRTHPHLSRLDQALLRELATGVLRWRARLDYVIGQTAGRPVSQLHPLVLDLLRLTAYQLLFLDRIPPSAAVNEAVKLAKARRLPSVLVGFVNAVGRTLAAAGKNTSLPDPETAPVAALAAGASLPDWLAARWLEALGRTKAWARAQASNQHPPLTVRVNTSLVSPATLTTIFAGEGVTTAACQYSSVGLHLLSLPQSPFDLPSYQRGLWLFQDEAAQLATLMLDPHPGQAVLEIGAGRGGKTTHLAQILRGQGYILAVDHSRSRLADLGRHLQRLALTGVNRILADASQALPFRAAHRFDRILLDVPCSGLGVLRRHPELRWHRQPEDFVRFAHWQAALLQQAAVHLRPGGILLYITCTTERAENEQVVQDFLASKPSFTLEAAGEALPPSARQFLEPTGYFRTLPERDGLDGFFAAALRQQG